MYYADTLISQLDKWVGVASNKAIIDNYNNHTPLPRSYKVKYTDQWCATGLSSAIISCHMEELIGIECGCEEFVKILKSKGIWIEDGTVVPQRGDIILYNWDTKIQPNDGWSDHIGVVVEVQDRIKVIECNYQKSVNYRYVPIAYGCIRGFARPQYDAIRQSVKNTNEMIALEVIKGLWGRGEERKRRLTEAGYDYWQVQKIVNFIITGKK